MNSPDSDADRLLHDLTIEEPPLRPAGKYRSFSLVGDLMYSSGVVGRRSGEIIRGPLMGPQDVSQGENAAVAAVLLILRNAQQELGTLARVVKVVALNGYVSTGASFHAHVLVMDAASACIATLFPEAPLPVRTTVGVASLPGAGAVEVSMVLQIREPERISQ